MDDLGLFEPSIDLLLLLVLGNVLLPESILLSLHHDLPICNGLELSLNVGVVFKAFLERFVDLENLPLLFIFH